MIGVKPKTELEEMKELEENADYQEIMDKVVLATNGTELTTPETITELGWTRVPDRGMSESYGFLYYLGNWVLRFWSVAPRLELRYKNTVAWDSALVDPENFGPGKQIPIGLLKEKMIAHGIIN